MTIPERKPTERGQRKLKHAAQMAWFLLAGFLSAAYFKVPAEMFAGFAAGLAGISGAFVWGNSKEHASNPILPTPPIPQ
jgi:mannose/fructose/N-acetylgalactosamine-specific phosphotransferase system component IIC